MFESIAGHANMVRVQFILKIKICTVNVCTNLRAIVSSVALFGNGLAREANVPGAAPPAVVRGDAKEFLPIIGVITAGQYFILLPVGYMLISYRGQSY